MRSETSLGWLKAGSEASAEDKDCGREDEEDERDSERKAQIRFVGDGADDLRRKCVTEAMNEEEIERDGGGADWPRNRIDDGGVERTSVEEEKELGHEEHWDGPRARAKEEQCAEGQRERDAPEREQVERAMIGAQPALGDPAAYERFRQCRRSP